MEIEICGYSVQIFEEEKASFVFYLPVLSKEQGVEIWKSMQINLDKRNASGNEILTAPILVCIVVESWNHDLSPWPANKIFRKGEDFKGKADDFLKILSLQIIPETEKLFTFQVSRENRGIAGYSMAGLFSVYSLYRLDLFSMVASCSGSLWYDGFLDFVKQNKPQAKELQMYFSLGDAESNTKDLRMKKVGECTTEIANVLKEKGYTAFFEWNKGGHFSDVQDRIVKGIVWLLKNKKE